MIYPPTPTQIQTKDYFGIMSNAGIGDNGSTDGPSDGDKTPQILSPKTKVLLDGERVDNGLPVFAEIEAEPI